MHPWTNVTEEVFSKIGDYVPGTIIDQTQYFTALVGILANRDIQISDVRIKRRAHIAILKIELCIVQSGLGGLASCVNVTVLSEFILRFGDIAMRARNSDRFG